jgi:hypothetical protein
MGKWQVGIVVVFLVVYAITVIATGNAVWVIPGVILAVILLAYAGLNYGITKREYRKHGGDIEAEMSDNEDPIPSTHLIPDDVRPAGDTPEAHDELSPHDVPIGSPIRETVEAQAGGEDSETRGNAEGAAGGPSDSGASDDTGARTGEPQRSASEAK